MIKYSQLALTAEWSCRLSSISFVGPESERERTSLLRSTRPILVRSWVSLASGILTFSV